MHLLIASAGTGSRMGADKNKLLLEIMGKSVIAWTLEAANRSKYIDWVGIIGQESDRDFILPVVKSWNKEVCWIQGGSTRQESVQKGLDALPDEAEFVLIHDGARCLVEPTLFDFCSKELLEGQAIIAGTPVTDTIKRVDSERLITGTPDRASLWSAQTPQGFPVEQLKNAHKEALARGWQVTDDAALFEKLGFPVKILESTPSNIKVTTPFDLAIAEAVIEKRIIQ